jgi:hypothetical protein
MSNAPQWIELMIMILLMVCCFSLLAPSTRGDSESFIFLNTPLDKEICWTDESIIQIIIWLTSV